MGNRVTGFHGRGMCEKLVTVRLSKRLCQLLLEVIGERASDLLASVSEESKIVIRKNQMRRVQELIGDEFMAVGIERDGEPNTLGVELEELIDAFSPHGLE